MFLEIERRRMVRERDRNPIRWSHSMLTSTSPLASASQHDTLLSPQEYHPLP